MLSLYSDERAYSKQERVYWARFIDHLETKNMKLKSSVKQLKLVEIQNMSTIIQLKAQVRRLKEGISDISDGSPQGEGSIWMGFIEKLIIIF